MEDFKKAKKIIEQSKNISILPSPDFRGDSFPASLGLFYSLKDSRKNVNLLVGHFPEKFKFLKEGQTLLSPQGNFLISIKTAGTKISQLFYEKRKNGLNLFLKTNGEELKKENIALHSLRFGDLLITLGIESFKRVKEFLKEKPIIIINIDNQLENENYGTVNLIEVSSPSLSEIVFDFLISIDEKLFKERVTEALLAGIIQGTRNFQSLKLSSQTLQKASFLTEKGADLKKITSETLPELGQSSLNLFGEILQKLRVSEDKNLGWVILKKGDFLRTYSTPSDLVFSLERLALILPQKDFLILWESEGSEPLTRGVFYSQNQASLRKILENFEGGQKGNGILFSNKNLNCQKVKDKILKLI
ncbi:hypothetical protein KJA17_01620 [Patescibacteria group bacterium]|nr:hypothetical protein [Patescibacteria group bacterium]